MQNNKQGLKELNQIILLFEKPLFYLLIFLIPLQTRKFLYSWNPGEFNEYLNAYLYVTDLIVLALFLFWAIRSAGAISAFVPTFRFKYLSTILLCLFFLVATFSLTNVQNLGPGLYQLLKLGEVLLLFLYIQANFKLFNFVKVAAVFVASAISQSFWAIAQFLKQSDAGLKILQESPLSPDLPYVANFFMGSEKIIRAYGGFPHPNVLAAFLVAALFFLYFLFLRRQEVFKIWTGRRRLIADIILGIGLFILLLGLVVTFSRAALGVYLLATLALFTFLFLIRNLRKVYFRESLNLFFLLLTSYFLLSLIFFPYLISRFQVNPQEEAVVHRAQYSQEAQNQIKGNLLFGVGIGNFIPTFKTSFTGAYEEFYQPVHNIYLLVASEMGIIGLLVFLVLISGVLVGFKNFQSSISNFQNPFKNWNVRLNSSLGFSHWSLAKVCLLFTVFCFLGLGFFDHFFWTLQQGRLMFWVVLGLLSATTAVICQKE